MTALMHVISYLGSAGWYVPVLVVVFWCVSPRAGAWAAVVVTLSGALNLLLKVAIHAPRPYWTDPGIRAHETRTSFGMPSGHAQGSTVAYGLLGAAVARRSRARRSGAGRSGAGRGGAAGPRWPAVATWAGGGVVVVLVGVSRVYLGVHSAGQVVAGWLTGAALLVVAFALGPPVAAWWRRRPLPVQFGLSLAVALLFFVPTALAVWNLGDRRLPDAWARAIAAAGGVPEPVRLGDGAAIAGLLFGVLAGLSWLAAHGWFEAGGTLWRRAARVPVGAAGAGLLLLAGWPAGGHVAVAFVTHALVGAWMAGGAPETFVRLGLAARAPVESRRFDEIGAGRHS
ncbi:MAG TPA: phosphatase PAP2 family protein [Streptosporangiaceae bacterium]